MVCWVTGKKEVVYMSFIAITNLVIAGWIFFFFLSIRYFNCSLTGAREERRMASLSEMRSDFILAGMKSSKKICI